MLLRRITVERYGCFGSAEFEFRAGMNLISGGNDSGKTLLLTALPATLFGVTHGARLRSWGDLVCCRVSLLFEGDTRAVRVTRDLESNLVRLEERGAAGSWSDCFVGIAPPASGAGADGEYGSHLARLLAADGIPLLRALLDPLQSEGVLAAEGRLAEGLWPAARPATGDVQPIDAETRRREIAVLEAELADDRGEYEKGREYLAWIRKRWQLAAGQRERRGAVSGPAVTSEQAELLQRRERLQEELRRLGLPERFPDALPAMLAAAEGLRQELATLQSALNPLQRRRQGMALPRLAWPLTATLAGVALAAAAWWGGFTWGSWLAAGGAAVVLLGWGIYLLQLQQTRTARAAVDQELQTVETQRAAALARQQQLAEQFEACGLPSAPVEMVKLQQLCRRHEELISRYRQLCQQVGDQGEAPPAADQSPLSDQHLRPEELPEAEARLAALGASLREREARLQQLRAALPDDTAEPRASSSAAAGERLLAAIGQHLERLSGGRYREVQFEEGCLRLAIAPGRWAPPAACSRSAVTCLTLAVRMALAETAGCRLPLPVDDLALLIDQKRRQAAIRALERFSRDSQVLLASGDEELAKRAKKEQWQIIRLDLAQRQSPPQGEQADAGQLHLL